MQALETIGGLFAAVVFAVVVAALVATPQDKVSKRLDEGVSTVRATLESPAWLPIIGGWLAVAVLILVI